MIPCPVRHMGTEYSFEVLRAMYQYLAACPNFTFWEHTTAETLLVEEGTVQERG